MPDMRQWNKGRLPGRQYTRRTQMAVECLVVEVRLLRRKTDMSWTAIAKQLGCARPWLMTLKRERGIP